MKVAVIGSSGGMGRFFVGYFLSRGDRVTGSDIRKPETKRRGFTFVSSNARAIKGAELVIIATPVDATVKAVGDIADRLEKGTTVVEITSVKRNVLKRLKKELADRGVVLLSLHPLFGPSLASYGEMRVCVVETGEGSVDLARRLLPEALLVQMTEEEHDRTMGLILSLTHLMNIAYAGTVIRYLKPKEFRNVQTPTSAVQLTLAEGILSQDPTLYSYIQTENQFSTEFARALIDELTNLLKLIESGDRKGFEDRFKDLSKAFAGDSKAALDLVYQAFEKSSRQS